MEPRRRARDALGRKGRRDGGHVAAARRLIATHEVLKGERFGNSVLVASAAPLPLEALRRDVARANLPTGLREGAALVAAARRRKTLRREGNAEPATSRGREVAGPLSLLGA